MPSLGCFGPKSMNFLILMKFCMYPISKVLILNPSFAFENFESKLQRVLTNFLFLTKFHMYPIFEGVAFKSGIGFQIFRAQIAQFGHFRPKSSNFLSNLSVSYPSSKLLFSNLTLIFEKFEPKSLNLDIFGQKVLTF